MLKNNYYLKKLKNYSIIYSFQNYSNADRVAKDYQVACYFFRRIKSFDAAPRKHLLIAFDLIKLVFNNLVFIPLGMLSTFLMLKLFCKILVQRLVSLREVGIDVAAFLVKCVVIVVVG